MNRLWRSGMILTAVSFIAGLGNFAFQAVIGNKLKTSGEFGLMNTTLGFVGLLGLPLAIATTAITHYIARFNFTRDDARLLGLLAGCRKFLFQLTIAGSFLAIFLAKPLSEFLHLRTGLALAALTCALAGLWGGLATALCQGLGWFKRLALIGLLGVGLRLIFGWLIVLSFPTAEWAVLASGVGVIANLVLLFWKKDLARPADPVSPWNRELVQYFIVAAACGIGSFLFLQGDLLIVQRCLSQHQFSQTELDAYTSAGVFARALPMTVAPLLIVLFTHRSATHTGEALGQQLKLIGLYAGGLLIGAIGLMILRTFCLELIGRNTPEAAMMIEPLAFTMIFVALLQALATWALASRWVKIAFLYGCLGLAYWVALLDLSKSRTDLLRVMPIATGISFGTLFVFWLTAIRQHKSRPTD